MKTISIFIVMVLVVCSFEGFSQIKVYNDNRVKVFGDRPTDDANKDLSLQVYGKYGDFFANGRIGFGEYDDGDPLFYDNKVFFGELGTNDDSDKLDLCGSRGVYFTWGQGYANDNIIGKADLVYGVVNGVWTDVSKFQFHTDVYAHGVIINSDERFKENIFIVENATQKIMVLKPVSYNLKPDKAFSVSNNFSPETEKEKKDVLEFENTKQKLKRLENKRFGFIAQDLKTVVPEVVAEEKDDLYVDYIGLLPLLVEAIKGQQKQIASLKNLLKESK